MLFPGSCSDYIHLQLFGVLVLLFFIEDPFSLLTNVGLWTYEDLNSPSGLTYSHAYQMSL